MAKSFYEPKKVVRYQDSVLKPNVGLTGASTPNLGTTVSRVVPKTAQATPIPVASAAPTVPPTPSTPPPATVVAVTATPPAPAPAPAVTTPTPPQAPGETRGFVFDGATELTASLGTDYVYRPYCTIKGTFSPYWSGQTTGSFPILSISTPGEDTHRWDVYFLRTQNNSKYTDYVALRARTGSFYRETGVVMPNSPNFCYESASNCYIEIELTGINMNRVKVDGQQPAQWRYTSMNYGTEPTPDSIRDFALGPHTSASKALSIGGFMSGSDYFSGSIDNLALYLSARTMTGRSTMADLTEDSLATFYYKFEGNTNATRGIDLEVVGTELYVSSSL